MSLGGQHDLLVLLWSLVYLKPLQRSPHTLLRRAVVACLIIPASFKYLFALGCICCFHLQLLLNFGGGIFPILCLRNSWLLLAQQLSGFGKGISFWFCFHRCEGAASPEGPKAIVEGIIEEEEEEDEDDEGGVSVNKRKKEDDTEVGNFLLCFSTCLHGTSLAHGYPKDSWYKWEQLYWKLYIGTFVFLLGLLSLIPSWVVTLFLVFLSSGALNARDLKWGFCERGVLCTEPVWCFCLFQRPVSIWEVV